MSELQPADYVLCGIVLATSVTGLFRGLSGTLAFVVAVTAAAGIGVFGWGYSADYMLATWIRVVGLLVLVLLTFALVRVLAKKTVNLMLAQPSDALFGLLIGAVFGSLVAVAWAWSGLFLEYSALAGLIAGYLN